MKKRTIEWMIKDLENLLKTLRYELEHCDEQE